MPSRGKYPSQNALKATLRADAPTKTVGAPRSGPVSGSTVQWAAPWTPAPYRLQFLDQAPSLDRVGPPRRQSQGGARALWCSSGAAVRVILNALDAAALGKVLGRTDVARGRNGLHGVESRSHCALGPSVAQESEWMPGRLNVAGSVAAPCVDNRIMYNRGSYRCIAPRRGAGHVTNRAVELQGYDLVACVNPRRGALTPRKGRGCLRRMVRRHL